MQRVRRTLGKAEVMATKVLIVRLSQTYAGKLIRRLLVLWRFGDSQLGNFRNSEAEKHQTRRILLIGSKNVKLGLDKAPLFEHFSIKIPP